MSCSFFNIVGGICGAEERTSTSTSVIALTQCNKDIRHHKKFLKFSGIETEVELILARCGALLFDLFRRPFGKGASKNGRGRAGLLANKSTLPYKS